MSQNKIIIINKNNLDNQNGLKNRYVYKFSKSQQLKGKVSLSSIIMPYSTPNIYIFNCSFTIRYNTINTAIKIPTGFYTIPELNYYLQFVMKMTNNNIPYNIVNGTEVFFINLLYNIAYYSVEIRISPAVLSGTVGKSGSIYTGNTPQIRFDDKLNEIVGFPINQFFPPSIQSVSYSTISKNYGMVPNLSPSNVYTILCNLVNDTINIPSNIIYSFTPNTTYGSNINERPSSLLYVNINSGFYDRITLDLYDELNQPLLILDENLIITLYLTLEE